MTKSHTMSVAELLIQVLSGLIEFELTKVYYTLIFRVLRLQYLYNNFLNIKIIIT